MWAWRGNRGTGGASAPASPADAGDVTPRAPRSNILPDGYLQHYGIAVQAKAVVGRADDPLEREADAAAEAVVGGGAPPRLSSASGAVRDEARGDVGRVGAGAVDSALASGGGAPLPEPVRARMESGFSTDLGGVRVHTGAASEAASQGIGAEAFTAGQDIHFAAGRYAPETPAGQRLLAHEIAHTVQQRGGGPVQGKFIQRQESPGATGGETARRGGGDPIAAQLRERFPDGILVTLSVGEAYEKVERDAEPEALLDSMSDELWLGVWVAWALDHESQAAAMWPSVRAELGEDGEEHPADFTAGDEDAQRAMARLVYENRESEARGLLRGDATRVHEIARALYVNEHEIVSEAESFARDHQAVKGDEGAVVLGEPMFFAATAEISTRIVATHDAVLALLRANPADGGGQGGAGTAAPDGGSAPAPEGEARQPGAGSGGAGADERVARIKSLTLSAHGWDSGMGGRGRAAGGRIRERDLEGIAGTLGGVAAPDLRVRLFACGTANSGEGSFADTLRDRLVDAGLADAAVIAHVEPGHTTTNQTLRFFRGNEAAADWRLRDVFPEDFLRAELHRLGVVASPDDATPALINKFARQDDPVFVDPDSGARDNLEKTPLQMFLARDAWMEADMTSLDAFRDSVQRAWRSEVTIDSAMADRIRYWMLDNDAEAAAAARARAMQGRSSDIVSLHL